jgi:hypothetical protein
MQKTPDHRGFMSEFRDHVKRVLTVLPRQEPIAP